MDNDETLLTDYSTQDVSDESALTGRPSLVHVMVEDEYDVPFWNDLLTETRPEMDFDICPYQYAASGNISSLTKGKQHILQEARTGNLGTNNIGCIDSDWDYLLEPDTVDAGIVNECPYLIQTYTYSVENLLVEPASLPHVLCNATKEQTKVSYIALMEQLSVKLYPLLILALYHHKHRTGVFHKEYWADVMPKVKTFSSCTREELLSLVSNSVDAKIAHLQFTYAVSNDDLSALKADLLQRKNLKPQNAYKYVRGHDLFEYINTVFLKPEFGSLCSSHRSAIMSADATTDEKTNRIKQYAKYMKMPIEHYLGVNFLYKHYAPEYHMIQNEIREF